MKVVVWSKLSNDEKQIVLKRPMQTVRNELREKVTNIVAEVKKHGDVALTNFTKKFDDVELSELRVSENEFSEAEKSVTEDVMIAMKIAIANIRKFHQTQLPQTIKVETSPGIICEKQARAIEKIGLYVPGGTAPLPSTVMMLAVPANIAGCKTKILCTPPNKKGNVDPHILLAAKLSGIDKVYKVGGAQAVAAMAYGTETIPKVYKIFGPGNTWVTQAKILVAEDPHGASYDLPAGPSELFVIADEEANHEFVAADLLSQAEHGSDSQVILICLSRDFANKVQDQLQQQLTELPRREIIEQALSYAAIVIVDNLFEAIVISNQYAPEHLSLNITDAEKYFAKIQAAGSVFVGRMTPETMGDYINGSNHVLPTYGFARSISGLSVADFITLISFQTVSEQALQQVGPYAEKLATIEGLLGHKEAITKRLEALACQT